MTREDIIQMAREAGFNWPETSTTTIEERLERFAALAVAAEREAICPIVYGLCISDNNAQEIVNAIRARGSK
jgi:hypothetical protein